MATLSIELTNLTAAMLLRLSEKARQQGISSIEEYVCALIARDIARDVEMSTEEAPVESAANVRLRVVLDCIWQLAQTKGCTAAELDVVFAHARKEAEQVNGVGSEQSAELEPPLLGEHHPWAKLAGSLTGETWKEFMAELDRKHEASLQEAYSRLHAAAVRCTGTDGICQPAVCNTPASPQRLPHCRHCHCARLYGYHPQHAPLRADTRRYIR